MPDEDPFAKIMNGIQKYVVSTTLDTAEWSNSELVTGNVTEEISKLKQQHGGDISISGSGTLVQWLLQHDLLDELQLLVCPVILETGRRLFNDGLIDTKLLKLVEKKPFNTGMVQLSYQPARN
jgi:dihydrofolate reductase